MRTLRKLSAVMLLCLFCTSIYAQNDVTKFLGIPVDGTKSEMIKKLKSKGFVYNEYLDEFEGEFNGTDVQLSIVTNNNKVWRICVFDKYGRDEAQIKLRFNTLCKQFQNNGKYICLTDQSIPDDEDISDQMLLNSKKYNATFSQIPADTATLKKNVEEYLYSKYRYTKEDLENLSEERQAEIGIDLLLKFISKREVWFTIIEEYNKYRILMYYDNKYNEASGEDL
ncbi:MAG: hypothetical protein IJY36_03770 [Coprobacter sp.]|nr:hypothetical protein [Coprobacter sp.]